MMVQYIIAILGWIATAIGWIVAYFLQVSTLKKQLVIDEVKHISSTIRECTEKYIEYSQCAPPGDKAQLNELQIIMLMDRIIVNVHRQKKKGRCLNIDIPLNKYYEVITGDKFGSEDRNYITKERLKRAFSDGELLIENAESSINQ